MTVLFHDLQNSSSQLNGTDVSDVDAKNLLRSFKDRSPFIFELRNIKRAVLTVGFGGSFGFAQYGHSPGEPPYYVTCSNGIDGDDETVEFLAGNTPTPVQRRHCVAYDVIVKVVSHFISTGVMYDKVAWEQV